MSSQTDREMDGKHIVATLMQCVRLCVCGAPAYLRSGPRGAGSLRNRAGAAAGSLAGRRGPRQRGRWVPPSGTQPTRSAQAPHTQYRQYRHTVHTVHSTQRSHSTCLPICFAAYLKSACDDASDHISVGTFGHGHQGAENAHHARQLRLIAVAAGEGGGVSPSKRRGGTRYCTDSRLACLCWSARRCASAALTI